MSRTRPGRICSHNDLDMCPCSVRNFNCHSQALPPRRSLRPTLSPAGQWPGGTQPSYSTQPALHARAAAPNSTRLANLAKLKDLAAAI